MGIKGLFGFLRTQADKSHKVLDSQKAFTGRTLALDASTSLYQIMIALSGFGGAAGASMTNANNEVTSHVNGMLMRALGLLEQGVRPIFVFDGKPPELKAGELAVRAAKRAAATVELERAQEAGDQAAAVKAAKLTLRVSKEDTDRVKTLLRLMGVPIVEAPSEAEATCARLVMDGKADVAATEDADCLTFGASKVARHLFRPQSKKDEKPIEQFDLPVALQQLGMTMDQFIDFCILCGCDYSDTISNVGPATAVQLILEHKNIESILPHLRDRQKVPEHFPFAEAREQFKNPVVCSPSKEELAVQDPQYEALEAFLKDNSFNADRIGRIMERLRAARAQKTQKTLDNFFTKQPRSIEANDMSKRALAARKAVAKKNTKKVLTAKGLRERNQ